MSEKIENVKDLDYTLKALKDDIIGNKLKSEYDKENKSYVFSLGKEKKFTIDEKNIAKVGTEFQKELLENFRKAVIEDIKQNREKVKAITGEAYEGKIAKKNRKELDSKINNAKDIFELQNIIEKSFSDSNETLGARRVGLALKKDQIKQLGELNNQAKINYEAKKKDLAPQLQFISEFIALNLETTQADVDKTKEGKDVEDKTKEDAGKLEKEVLEKETKDLLKRYKNLRQAANKYTGISGRGDGIKNTYILKSNIEIIKHALQNQKQYKLKFILKTLNLDNLLSDDGDDGLYGPTKNDSDFEVKQGTLKDAKKDLEYVNEQFNKIEARLTNSDVLTQTLFKVRVNKNRNEKDENLPDQDKNYDFDFGTNDQKQIDSLNKILTKVIEENKGRIAKKFNLALKRLHASDQQKFANYLDDVVDGRLEPEKFQNIDGLDNNFLDDYNNYYTLVQQAKNVFCYPGFVNQQTPENYAKTRFTSDEKKKKNGKDAEVGGAGVVGLNGIGSNETGAINATGIPYLDAVSNKGVVRGSIEQGIDAIMKLTGHENNSKEFTQLKSAAGWIGAGALAFFAGRSLFRSIRDNKKNAGKFPWLKAIATVAGVEVGSRMLFNQSALKTVGGLFFGKEVGGNSTNQLINRATNLGTGFVSTKTEKTGGSGEVSNTNSSVETGATTPEEKEKQKEIIDYKAYQEKLLYITGNLDRKTLKDNELVKEENGKLSLNLTNLEDYYKDGTMSASDKTKAQEYIDYLAKNRKEDYEQKFLEKDAGITKLSDLDLSPDMTVAESVVDSVTKDVEDINDKVKSKDLKYKNFATRQQIIDEYRVPSNKDKSLGDLVESWKARGLLIDENSVGGILPLENITEAKNLEGRQKTTDLFRTLEMSKLKDYIKSYDSDGNPKEIDMQKVRQLENYAEFKKFYYSTEQEPTIIQAMKDLGITESFIKDNATTTIEKINNDIDKQAIVDEFQKNNYYDIATGKETIITDLKKKTKKADLQKELELLSKVTDETKNPFVFKYAKSPWFTNIAPRDGKSDALKIGEKVKDKNLTLNQKNILIGMTNALSDKISGANGKKFQLGLEVDDKGNATMDIEKEIATLAPEAKARLTGKKIHFNVNDKTINNLKGDDGNDMKFDNLEDLMMTGFHTLGLMATLTGQSEIDDKEYFSTSYFSDGLSFKKKTFVGSVKAYRSNMSWDEKAVYLASWAVLPIAPYLGATVGPMLATGGTVFSYGYLGLYGPNFMDFYHGSSSFTKEGKYQSLQKLSEGDNMKRYATYLNTFDVWSNYGEGEKGKKDEKVKEDEKGEKGTEDKGKNAEKSEDEDPAKDEDKLKDETKTDKTDVVDDKKKTTEKKTETPKKKYNFFEKAPIVLTLPVLLAAAKKEGLTDADLKRIPKDFLKLDQGELLEILHTLKENDSSIEKTEDAGVFIALNESKTEKTTFTLDPVKLVGMSSVELNDALEAVKLSIHTNKIKDSFRDKNIDLPVAFGETLNPFAIDSESDQVYFSVKISGQKERCGYLSDDVEINKKNLPTLFPATFSRQNIFEGDGLSEYVEYLNGLNIWAKNRQTVTDQGKQKLEDEMVYDETMAKELEKFYGNKTDEQQEYKDAIDSKLTMETSGKEKGLNKVSRMVGKEGEKIELTPIKDGITIYNPLQQITGKVFKLPNSDYRSYKFIKRGSQEFKDSEEFEIKTNNLGEAVKAGVLINSTIEACDGKAEKGREKEWFSIGFNGALEFQNGENIDNEWYRSTVDIVEGDLDDYSEGFSDSGKTFDEDDYRVEFALYLDRLVKTGVIRESSE